MAFAFTSNAICSSNVGTISFFSAIPKFSVFVVLKYRFFMRLRFREWSRIDGKFLADWNFFFQVLALVTEVTLVV
jgi:hypothetical protein